MITILGTEQPHLPSEIKATIANPEDSFLLTRDTAKGFFSSFLYSQNKLTGSCKKVETYLSSLSYLSFSNCGVFSGKLKLTYVYLRSFIYISYDIYVK